jgi:hypothetical protein
LKINQSKKIYYFLLIHLTFIIKNPKIECITRIYVSIESKINVIFLGLSLECRRYVS